MLTLTADGQVVVRSQRVSFTALSPSVKELERHISGEICFQRWQTYLVKVVKVILAVAAARVGSSGGLVVSKTVAPAYKSKVSDDLSDSEVEAHRCTVQWQRASYRSSP